jgi:hypothetical protein
MSKSFQYIAGIVLMILSSIIVIATLISIPFFSFDYVWFGVAGLIIFLLALFAFRKETTWAKIIIWIIVAIVIIFIILFILALAIILPLGGY